MHQGTLHAAFGGPGSRYALIEEDLQAAGSGSDQAQLRLDRPDSEKVAQALENLLTDINQDPPRMLGDGPTLRFIVQR